MDTLQEKVASMKKIEIYGHSDVCIEVDGAFSEEGYANSDGRGCVIVSTSAGRRLVFDVAYTSAGIWRIDPRGSELHGLGVHIKRGPEVEDESGYTDRATVTGDIARVDIRKNWPPTEDEMREDIVAAVDDLHGARLRSVWEAVTGLKLCRDRAELLDELGVEAAGPGLVWVPIDRVIRSAATQLGLVPTDALNALAGAWPGDETDEELSGAMRDWDGYITPQPTVATHRCIPIARLEALEAAEARAEAAEAQLAALREAAREMEGRAGTAYEFASDSYPEDEEDRFLAAEKALAAVLADDSAAATAEAYTRRVRAEALRMVADAWEREASREVCCEDHERGVAEAHEPCCATGRAAEARARMTKEREAEMRAYYGAGTVSCLDHVDDVRHLLAELDAERERAEAAEAQLAALRDVARPAARILDRMHMEEWGPLFETLTNTAATAEAYTRRVRAQALREMANALEAAVPGDYDGHTSRVEAGR